MAQNGAHVSLCTLVVSAVGRPMPHLYSDLFELVFQVLEVVGTVLLASYYEAIGYRVQLKRKDVASIKRSAPDDDDDWKLMGSSEDSADVAAARPAGGGGDSASSSMQSSMGTVDVFSENHLEEMSQEEIEQLWRVKVVAMEDARLAERADACRLHVLHWDKEGHVVWDAIEQLDKAGKDPGGKDTIVVEGISKIHRFSMTNTLHWAPDTDFVPSDKLILADIIAFSAPTA